MSAIADEPPASAPSTSAATNPTYTIDVDTSQVPELHDYGPKVQQVADAWYPLICKMLPGEGFSPPTHVIITFVKDMKGVADTSGDRVRCAPEWFIAHPEDLGAIVHELTHVVQHYTIGRRPGWLVEGIADYVRFFHYEPASQRPHPDPRAAHFSDSYRTSAAFLDWASRAYDKDLVVKLNDACRRGIYSDQIWQRLTGLDLPELDAKWRQQLGGR